MPCYVAYWERKHAKTTRRKKIANEEAALNFANPGHATPTVSYITSAHRRKVHSGRIYEWTLPYTNRLYTSSSIKRINIRRRWYIIEPRIIWPVGLWGIWLSLNRMITRKTPLILGGLRFLGFDSMGHPSALNVWYIIQFHLCLIHLCTGWCVCVFVCGITKYRTDIRFLIRRIMIFNIK